MTDVSTAWGGNPDTHTATRSAIDAVAESYGIAPSLAEAIGEHESGFNPYAVGDQGTSFGAFQLHEGGELDNLPGTLDQRISEAQNPTTNAQVALSEVAAVEKANPGLDPGWVAADAQRPADPGGYATEIDRLLAGGTIPDPTGPGSASSVPAGGGTNANPAGLNLNPFDGFGIPGMIFGSIKSSIVADVMKAGLNLTFLAAGFGLVAIGANRAAKGKTQLGLPFLPTPSSGSGGASPGAGGEAAAVEDAAVVA